MPLISESVGRIRVLINDKKTDALGDLNPDIRFNDDDIVVEIQSALREKLKNSPSAFFGEAFTAPTTINNLNLSSQFPIDDKYIPEIEKMAALTLETTEQEGATSDAILRIIPNQQ